MSVRIATRALLAVLALHSGDCLPAPAALSPGQLLQLAEQSTFEVVLPKFEPDYVHYEKPLPLELLSYRERTDKFWSIGTAFAIAPDTYVSAAHVLLGGIGSPLGRPQLRDAQGHTYPIEQVVKFSLHEDYVVFRARGAIASRVLEAERSATTGSSVYAVGNALGDGVVLRDGLLTSLTPEDQDGRWKWLRFSAAASPGNSGGPLLDAEGHVLGVVTAKSPSENLNYALPIGRVLDGQQAAVFDVRSSFSLPILRQQMVTVFKDSFALPASWDDFARTLIDHSARQFADSEHRLLEEHAAELPPRGNAGRLLATLDRGTPFGLLHQQDDDTWGISSPEQPEETSLPGDAGTLWTGSLPGAFSFRLERPLQHAAPGLYHDDVAFMDTILKGLKFPRVIGSQAIRITSLGAPQQQELHTDRFGRIWQMRTWSVGYSDMLLVTLALPTPDGYAGLLQATRAGQYRDTVLGLQLLADYAHVRYRGSPAQWQELLAENKLCPEFLRGITFGKDSATIVPLHGLSVNVPAGLLPLNEQSILNVYLRYRGEGASLRAEPDGLTLEVSAGSDTSWIGIWAQPRAAEGAGTELVERWRQMNAHEGNFNGVPQHDSDYGEFWADGVLGDPGQDPLYEVNLDLHENGLQPRQVTERRNRLLAGLQPRHPGQ